MNNMKKNYSDSDISVQVGDRIILDDQEWKVAEIIDDTVTLYREGVGGMSHTIHMPVEEAETLLPEQA